MTKNLESKIKEICKKTTAIVKNLGEGETQWHDYRIHTKGWYRDEQFQISITESELPESVLIFYNHKEVFYIQNGEKPVKYYRRGKWESKLDTIYERCKS